MKTLLIPILFVFIATLSDSLNAQVPENVALPSLEDQLISEPAERRDGVFWTLNVENDFLVVERMKIIPVVCVYHTIMPIWIFRHGRGNWVKFTPGFELMTRRPLPIH